MTCWRRKKRCWRKKRLLSLTGRRSSQEQKIKEVCSIHHFAICKIYCVLVQRCYAFVSAHKVFCVRMLHCILKNYPYLPFFNVIISFGTWYTGLSNMSVFLLTQLLCTSLLVPSWRLCILLNQNLGLYVPALYLRRTVCTLHKTLFLNKSSPSLTRKRIQCSHFFFWLLVLLSFKPMLVIFKVPPTFFAVRWNLDL